MCTTIHLILLLYSQLYTYTQEQIFFRQSIRTIDIDILFFFLYKLDINNKTVYYLHLLISRELFLYTYLLILYTIF